MLVLGAGGNVSQGVLKALALSSLPVRTLAACIDPLSPGLYAAERAFVSPLADDPGFVDWLCETCEVEGVDAVLSGAEPVLSALAVAAGEVRSRCGAVCVVSPAPTYELARDKLRAARWMAERGLPAPRFADAADPEAVRALVKGCGFPLIAKPRHGKGAVGVVEVAREAQLAGLAGREGVLLQERLDEPEYTVGCLCGAGGALRGSIAMRRELSAGTTTYAEAGEFPAARTVAERLVGELAPVGPCNVQLRERDGEPVAFEVNARFSGTTPVRARLGFNEVEAALRELVLGEEPAPMPRVVEGVVVRYWNEVYPSPRALARLRTEGRLDSPRSQAVVEDWP